MLGIEGVAVKNKILKNITIIGAGPAGLTAGYELSGNDNYRITILEKEPSVGGLAITKEYKGCKFDIGPHHYLTDVPKIERWWRDFMGDQFEKHKRFTRIYYKKHFFNYPLEPINVLRGLSFFECVRCVISYLRYKIFPIKPVVSFQDWVTNRFGYRLFSMFFKTYTEKLWGISCTKLSADWAAQRIKTFSLFQAIFFAFFGRWFKKYTPRTIQDTFYYPVLGSGSLWELVAQKIHHTGSRHVMTNESVVSIEHDNKKIRALYTRVSSDSHVQEGPVCRLERYELDFLLSSMPLRDFILALDPVAPAAIILAAKKLAYRGLITINFIINKPNICNDHWIYIHEKEILLTRLDNMTNFSLKLVDHPTHSAITLEYFAFVGDSLWQKTEQELIALGKQELASTGLVTEQEILDGMVLRAPDAYPVYDEYYQENLKIVLDYISRFENLQCMGRNGTHQYNSMDVAMLTAFSAVEKVNQYMQTKKQVIKKNDVRQATV